MPITTITSTVTFSANSASGVGGGMLNYDRNPTLINVIIANSSRGGDCANDGTSTLYAASSHNLIEDSANACGLVNGDNGTYEASAREAQTQLFLPLIQRQKPEVIARG